MARKQKFKRVNTGDDRVVFTLPDVYGDAEFVMPSADRMPNGVMRALKRDELDALFIWFEKMGVDAETLDAIDDLTADETMRFIQAWTRAEGVDLPKSSD